MMCRKCIVRGRVQGVFYRASTQHQANALHVTGHAKNLRNGDVEVLMCGDAVSIDKLSAWLWEGPQYAEVHEVTCHEAQPDPLPDHFSTGW